jgi:hypothetical protein
LPWVEVVGVVVEVGSNACGEGEAEVAVDIDFANAEGDCCFEFFFGHAEGVCDFAAELVDCGDVFLGYGTCAVKDEWGVGDFLLNGGEDIKAECRVGAWFEFVGAV